jgi:hypothetical protein
LTGKLLVGTDDFHISRSTGDHNTDEVPRATKNGIADTIAKFVIYVVSNPLTLWCELEVSTSQEKCGQGYIYQQSGFERIILILPIGMIVTLAKFYAAPIVD